MTVSIYSAEENHLEENGEWLIKEHHTNGLSAVIAIAVGPRAEEHAYKIRNAFQKTLEKFRETQRQISEAGR